MRLKISLAVCAVSAAVLLGGGASNHGMEGQGALPIGNGNGVTGAPGEGLRSFAFSLVERPNGSLRGHGVLTNLVPFGQVRFDITSYTVVDDVLLMAGPITNVFGDTPPVFFEGATFFFGVRDDGNGVDAVDEISGAMAAPIPDLTIDDILFLLCSADPNCDPNEPIVIPPDALGPILTGNINVFYDNL